MAALRSWGVPEEILTDNGSGLGNRMCAPTVSLSPWKLG